MPRYTATLSVTQHQFWIQPLEPGFEPGDPVLIEGPVGSALLASSERALMVMTGVWGGPVEVEVVVLDSPLDRFDPHGTDAEWDAIAESTVDFGTSTVLVAALGEDAPDGLDTIPVRDQGPTTVRVLASGRDADYDAVVDTSIERYLIVMAPATVDRPAATSRVDETTATERQKTTPASSGRAYQAQSAVAASVDTVCKLVQRIVDSPTYNWKRQGPVNALGVEVLADEIDKTLEPISMTDATQAAQAVPGETATKFAQMAREVAAQLRRGEPPASWADFEALISLGQRLRL